MRIPSAIMRTVRTIRRKKRKILLPLASNGFLLADVLRHQTKRRISVKESRGQPKSGALKQAIEK